MFGPLVGVMMPLGEGIDLKVSCDQREMQETYGSSRENSKNDIDKSPSVFIIIINVMVVGDHTSIRYLFGRSESGPALFSISSDEWNLVRRSISQAWLDGESCR